MPLTPLRLLIFVFASASAAQAQIFTGLGILPGATGTQGAAISRDGLAVAGFTDPAHPMHAFRWTRAGGLLDLGVVGLNSESRARAISNNGAAVVGSSFTGTGPHTAFLWTAATGAQPLPSITAGTAAIAATITPDGHFAAGGSGVSGGHPTRWNQTTPEDLGVPTGFTFGFAFGISDDGSVVIGSAQTTSLSSSAFRWSADTGIHAVASPPTYGQSYAWAISPDGGTIVGEVQNALGATHAFKWNASTGMVDIGLATGLLFSSAQGCSADGDVIVGGSNNQGSPQHAWVWSSRLGAVDLNTYLPTLGVSLTGWTLNFAFAVSADGRSITGNGTHDGHNEAFVVVLPLVCGTADFNNDGDSGTDADIEAFFGCLAGNCCATCFSGGADFNGDGDVGTDGDIEAFFRVLAGGPC